MHPRRSLGKVFMSATEAIDKAWGWHRLPLPLALVVLEGIRMRMRQQNLYDPATAAYDRDMKPAQPEDDRYLTRRTADGPTTISATQRWGASKCALGETCRWPKLILKPGPA
jgi:hypothetical protein